MKASNVLYVEYVILEDGGEVNMQINFRIDRKLK